MIRFKETETIELKKSTSELKEAVISIVSILNKHKNGCIYFGIKDDGTIIGQNIGSKTIRDISKTIADNIEPKIFPSISEVKIGIKNCIKVAFEGVNCPYFAYGRGYVRVGDEDRKLTVKELERLFNKTEEASWEKQISSKSSKDINARAVKEYVSIANQAKRIDFKFSNVFETLNKLGLIKNKKLLRAAEILFCDNNSVEIQAAVFAGTDKVTFLDIRQFKGNLFKLLKFAESYIKEHMNWRAELLERERKEIPEIPLRAIMEALINSLCHRDYANPKGNEIAIFKDRVEIYNPGQFPQEYSPIDFIKGRERSILRNPLIANTLYLSKDIERWGSGMKRIYDACAEQRVKVKFSKLKSGFLVTFFRAKEKTTPNYPQLPPTTPMTMPNKEKDIIKLIKQNPKITKENLAKELNVTIYGIKYYIRKLKEKRKLEWVGSSKFGYWKFS